MTVFNDQQKEIINAVDGVFVAIAGPGSGKTSVLLERHLQMLIKGVDQKDILNLTFTSSAAKEMVKRIGLLDAESVFRTFHSYALDLLKRERAHVPFEMTDEILPFRAEDYKLLFDLVKLYPAISSFRTLQERISEWKRRSIEPPQALSEAQGTEYFYAAAYEEYEKRCREEGWLDFDSLMREAVKLLEGNDEVRRRNIKKYISVDECQDTDTTQFRLLQLLYGGNILCVGDENQLIYEWRSAQSGNLTNFARIFPGARTLYLGRNYRSTGRLVQFFKDILPVNNGLASHMSTTNADGTEPTFIKYPEEDTEARKVLEAASKDPENSVIIARTNRILFNIQRVAASLGIKYKNLGKKDFWETNEVKALIKMAKDGNMVAPAHETLDRIVKQDLAWRYRNSADGQSNPVENLNNVVKIAGSKGGTVFEFLAYINRLTHGRKSRKEKDLMLATVHQAKGREWKHVFIVGAEHGVMPHKDGELPEERRIFFVACSRSAETLQISWSGSRSMFIPENYLSKIQVYQESYGSQATTVS